MKEIKITLTEDEAKVVANYLLKKAMRLEDSGLTDSYCYPRIYKTYLEIKRALKESE